MRNTMGTAQRINEARAMVRKTVKTKSHVSVYAALVEARQIYDDIAAWTSYRFSKKSEAISYAIQEVLGQATTRREMIRDAAKKATEYLIAS